MAARFVITPAGKDFQRECLYGPLHTHRVWAKFYILTRLYEPTTIDAVRADCARFSTNADASPSYKIIAENTAELFGELETGGHISRLSALPFPRSRSRERPLGQSGLRYCQMASDEPAALGVN